jgi:hypothetical protein
MSDAGNVVPLPDLLAKAKEKLAPFLALNPKSSIEPVKSKSKPVGVRISDPWGDKSLALNVPAEIDEFAAVMNNLVLPERLSALWHQNQASLEFIWTALPLSENWREVKGRRFNFRFDSIVHTCEFRASSMDLLSIAKQMRPLQNTNTSFRNLQSFSIYAQFAETERQILNLTEPLSFWVSHINVIDEATIGLLKHLNFFMTYYDELTPTILIHDVDEPLSMPTRLRYIKGAFPFDIKGRNLDVNLLDFWAVAQVSNPILRFILYYRIIEYAAFHFIDDKIRSELKKLLAAPDLATQLSQTVDSIVSTVTVSKLEDVQRLRLIPLSQVALDVVCGRS